MSKIVYQLNVVCQDNTTSNRVNHVGWYPEVLDHCPNNDPNHNYVMTSIISTIQDNYIIPRKITDDTGGNFRARGFDFDVPAGPETEFIEIGTRKFLTKVRIGTCTITPHHDCIGDYLSVFIRQDGPIGGLRTTANSGNTVINVSNTVLQYLELGHHVELNDGAGHVEILGECISKDFIAKTITTEKAINTTFATGTPLYLRVYFVDLVRIASDNPLPVGLNTAGSTSLININQTVHIMYQNKTNIAKFIAFSVEMFY